MKIKSCGLPVVHGGKKSSMVSYSTTPLTGEQDQPLIWPIGLLYPSQLVLSFSLLPTKGRLRVGDLYIYVRQWRIMTSWEGIAAGKRAFDSQPILLTKQAGWCIWAQKMRLWNVMRLLLIVWLCLIGGLPGFSMHHSPKVLRFPIVVKKGSCSWE